MNLTTKGRYAVMAMLDMALYNVEDLDKPIKLSCISERQKIALNYLEQIFMKLRKTGLVQSVRGPGGGYVFTKSIDQITIAEIVAAVDESIEMTRCGNKMEFGCNSSATKCLTHDLWKGLGDQIFSYLNSISIADICNKSKAKNYENYIS